MPEPAAGTGADTAPGPRLRLVRADDRFVSHGDGIETRHCFSFGEHYDPDNVGFGALLAVNEEVVAPGHGYAEHHHEDLEIVTWVLEGELGHEDTARNSGAICPGQVQRLSAGAGVSHAERNASPMEPLRFIQMWLRPDRFDDDPAYAQVDLSPELTAGGLVRAVGPDDAAPITLRQQGATLWVATLSRKRVVELPPDPLLHLHVTRGSVGVEIGAQSEEPAHTLELAAGDTLRIETRESRVRVVARELSELLTWGMRPPS